MFKIGDVVVLKSSPNFPMTVANIDGDEVSVSYYNSKESCFTGTTFHASMLEMFD